MSLVTWGGKLLLSPNGKLTLGPAAAACCCLSDCCCDALNDLFVEATVGTCYATDQMTRQADGTYAGDTIKSWKIELSLGGSDVLTVFVFCWCNQIGFYPDDCSGVPADFDEYDPTEPQWNVVENCVLPQTFTKSGAGGCYDASCGTPPLDLVFTVDDTAF